MTAVTFKFEEPKYLLLQLPNTDISFKVDLYACWNAVVKADEQPDQPSRWRYLQDFILKTYQDAAVAAGIVDVEETYRKEVWEGTAREFRKLTIEQMDKYEAIVKKKFESIASLDITIQDLQDQDGSNGPSGTNDVG